MVSDFEKFGFQVFKNVFSPTHLKNLRDKIALHIESKLKNEYAEYQLNLDNDETWNALNYEKLDNFLQHIYRGEAPLEIRTDEDILSLGSHNDRLFTIINDIFDQKDLGMHTPPSVRVIRPNSSLGMVPAHIDTMYNSHMKNFVTVWVPLNDISPNCPGMAIKEISDSRYSNSELFNKRGHWHFPLFDDNDYYEPIYMNLGDILVFKQWIVHKSLKNISNNLRISIDFRFFPLNSGSSKSYRELSRNG